MIFVLDISSQDQRLKRRIQILFAEFSSRAMQGSPAEVERPEKWMT